MASIRIRKILKNERETKFRCRKQRGAFNFDSLTPLRIFLPMIPSSKIAIVHDWLTGMRGGEKVLEVLCELYPDATLFTLVHKKGSLSPAIERMKIRTSYLQSLPGGLS